MPAVAGGLLVCCRSSVRDHAPALLVLFPAIAQPLAVLVTFGVCAAFALAARHYAEELYGGITAEMITLAGAVTELAALLCGVLLIR